MKRIAILAASTAQAFYRPLTDGTSSFWKGGELSFDSGEELHGLADPFAFVQAPLNVWVPPNPHMKVNFPLSELKVLLAALQTHPPRLLFNHHPYVPAEIISTLPWHLRNIVRDISALYPKTVLRGFESGNYGNYTDADGQDIFGAHLLGEDPHMNVCDYYVPPKECLSMLNRDCLVASARRWGGSHKDVFLSKHLGVGHVSLPKDPRRVTQAVLEIGCNVWVSDVSTDAVMDLFDSGELNMRGEEAKAYARGKSTNDPFFDRQWFLKDQKIDEAWSTEKGQSGVKVMVVDTGIDFNHNDLKKNMWKNKKEQENQKDDDDNGYVDDMYGINPSSSNGDVMDDEGHGTHMAGILSAVTNNGQGVAGINWGAKVSSCRFIISGQPGKMSDTAKCIDYAVDAGVKVISCSFGGGAGLPQLKKAIESACQKGVITVAAAGNSKQDNDREECYPSNYATELEQGCVISVGGHCKNQSMIDYGSYGANKVLVSAPGDYIYSLGPGNDYAYRGGTSPATPNIAGIIALGLSANGNLSPSKIFSALQNSVEKVSQLNGKVKWGGKIDAAKFIQKVKSS